MKAKILTAIIFIAIVGAIYGLGVLVFYLEDIPVVSVLGRLYRFFIGIVSAITLVAVVALSSAIIFSVHDWLSGRLK